MENKYEVVMGLEIHARINTKAKMFCACDNDIFTAEPNANTCSICMGHPGMLPVLNAEAYRKGILTGLALGCKIPNFAKFDRKSYFYPDLPKGYQISEYDQPIAVNGKVKISVEGEEKVFGITRLHLEDDAGKLTHTNGGTLVDYNRSGTPLMEIVTEPDFRSIAEVKTFLQELQKLLRYINTSQADMEKGMLRCDVNVSIRPIGQKALGTRAEIKNMNSFKMVEKAVEYEIKRQIKEVEAGNKIVQETRGWDEAKGVTLSQRGKEDAMDYRYFPEPDLPPMTITEEEVAKIAKELPELPIEKRIRFRRDYEMNEKDAETLTSSKDLADYFEEVAKKTNQPKKSANWILNEVFGGVGNGKVVLTEKAKGKNILDASKGECYTIEIENFIDSSSLFPFPQEYLVEIIDMVENEKIISGNLGKQLLGMICDLTHEPKSPRELVEEQGLKQISDTGELEKIIAEVLAQNQNIVNDYLGGKDKALGALVGKVMAMTKGQANPQMVNELLVKLIH